MTDTRLSCDHCGTDSPQLRETTDNHDAVTCAAQPAQVRVKPLVWGFSETSKAHRALDHYDYMCAKPFSSNMRRAIADQSLRMATA